jgi:hypothetical protein
MRPTASQQPVRNGLAGLTARATSVNNVHTADNNPDASPKPVSPKKPKNSPLEITSQQ